MGSKFEQELALLEAYLSSAEEAYFQARPAMDNDNARNNFREGFKRGWVNVKSMVDKNKD